MNTDSLSRILQLVAEDTLKIYGAKINSLTTLQLSLQMSQILKVVLLIRPGRLATARINGLDTLERQAQANRLAHSNLTAALLPTLSSGRSGKLAFGWYKCAQLSS